MLILITVQDMNMKSAIAITLIGVFVGVAVWNVFKSADISAVEEKYWGPGDPHEDNKAIMPFEINISKQVLNDLKTRLNNRKNLTKSLENSNHHYGLNADLVDEVMDYWKDDYDWRKREEYLNKFPQFVTEIQGLKIHFIHAKPASYAKKTIPLLMIHGWPSSVFEFYDIIPMLTEVQPGRDFAFEVIVPSIPGTAFSSAASKQDFGVVEVSVVLNNLMKKIGFDKYYVQGGDLGGVLVPYLGIMFPDQVLGIHSNMCYSLKLISKVKLVLGNIFPSLFMTEDEASKSYPIYRFAHKVLLETGYIFMHITKPDMMGYALNESPTGLAVFILEKFAGMNMEDIRDLPDAGLKSKYTIDKLLDNIMIYWVTNSITSGMRIYADSYSIKQRKYGMNSISVKVPSACARFENEVFYQSEWLIRDAFENLVHLMDYKSGGHFPALEVPMLLAEDIFNAIEK
ncbi:PREDICTED: juvenile hormone epoxide hydrolase 1-like, partial [Nicrophorus vespilloides]|uniref:Epoxide hydrolase n=1 Tax=Nicrophorus vespilloides TaxID=110193 RepID=A0ABM1M6U4_NICVS